MKYARTVCGDIEADKMGFTYPHEHLYAVPPACQKDRDLELSDYESSVKELKNFKEVGGCTLVDSRLRKKSSSSQKDVRRDRGKCNCHHGI